MTTDFQTKMQEKKATIYKRLNASGKNLGGRLPLQLQIWQTNQAGGNPLKKTSSLILVPDSGVNLIPIETRIGDAKRWIDDALTRVGDVDLEIAALDFNNNLLTRDQLLGIGLPSAQQLRYQLGTEQFTIAAGTLVDADGISFKMALVRVPV